ncbi:MAG TPA: hypothetical protein VI193_09675 [Acidimicrobiia bacterium]
MSTYLILRLGRGFGMGWHGMALRWVAVLALLFFIALLVAGVVLLFRQGSTKTASLPMDQALITIRMRYAQGEMTTQEFLDANEALGGRPPTPPPPPPAPPA